MLKVEWLIADEFTQIAFSLARKIISSLRSLSVSRWELVEVAVMRRKVQNIFLRLRREICKSCESANPLTR